MKVKNILPLLLALCMVITLLPVSASAATIIDSGTCGANGAANLHWYMDDAGKLTITGSGRMADYNLGAYNTVPWVKYLKDITEVYVDYGPSYIGNNAFYGCTNLTKVTLASSVRTLGDYVFGNCISLTDLPKLSSISTLGTSVFYGCKSLTEVTVPQSITTVAGGMFSKCENLVKVTFEGSIVDIGSGAFGQCYALEEVIFKRSVSGELGSGAFGSCTSLKEFTIPKGITTIKENAFNKCSSLTTVTIPQTVESIWNYAFRESGLVSVTIPESVTYMGSSLFSSCYNLQDITLHASSLDNFKYYLSAEDNLTYVHVIGDAPNISKNIFGNRKETVVVYYDEGTSGWEGSTWNGYAIEPWTNAYVTRSGTCGDQMTWILEDDTLTISGSGDMYHYGNYYSYTPSLSPWYLYRNRVSNVVIENGVENIGEYAFFGLHNLTDISMPSSLTAIDKYAFDKCSGMTSVTMPDSVLTLGYSAFSNCTNLTDVTLSASLTELSGSVFTYCESLTEITLPEGIVKIGESAFQDCESLTTITIPASVTHIYNYAFGYCSSLQYVYFEGNAPVMGSDMLRQVVATCIYPVGNDTWTKDVMKYYGGTSITWQAAPHDHEYEAVVTAPTCTEQGYTTYSCTLCVESYVADYTDPTGHTPGEVQVENVVDATCTAKGSCDHVTYCTVCGTETSRETVEIEMISHSYSTEVTAPTCTEQGYTTYTCDVCGNSYVSDYVSALGHTSGEYRLTLAPTRYKTGSITAVCSVCGDDVTVTLPALNSRDYTVEVTLEPTETETGTALYTWNNTGYGTFRFEVTLRSLGDRIPLGDVNGDGFVNLLDANLAAAFYSGRFDLTEDELTAADVNGDGAVNILDANLIAAYYNEAIDTFPAA